MGDHDLADLVRHGLQELLHLQQAAQGDAAVLDRPAKGGVDPHHQHLAVAPDRLELRAEVLPVGAEGIEEPLPDAVEGDVVIARHHQAGHRDAVDEGAGLAELLGRGPLRQVAGDDDEIRPVAVDQLQHPLGDPGQVRRSEVDVGDVQDRAQGLVRFI